MTYEEHAELDTKLRALRDFIDENPPNPPEIIWRNTTMVGSRLGPMDKLPEPITEP